MARWSTALLFALVTVLSACGDAGFAVVGSVPTRRYPLDVPTGCSTNADCVGDPGGPICNTATRRCVRCLGDSDCGQNMVCVDNVCTSTCPLPRRVCNGVCVDVTASAAHCGMCGNMCPTGPRATAMCVDGMCAPIRCDDGFADCNMMASDGCEVDIRTSTMHCGGCGMRCASGAGSTATCVAGVCGLRCDTGRADCDMDPSNGCEVDTRTSTMSCGICGRMCASGPNSTATCMAGTCGLTCESNFADCNAQASDGCEVDTRTSTMHCGMCGRNCPAGLNSTATCTAGVCGLTCAENFADCNMMALDGCEVDVRTTVAHCGMCGRMCPAGPNSTATCAMGTCGLTCAPGFADCNRNPADGCEVDTRSDVGNCGGCGTRCMLANATAVCAMGACAVGMCNAGFADCDRNPANGCEANLATDNRNCGTCGTVCTTGAQCTFGYCHRFPSTGVEGVFSPTRDTTLPPGVHNFTTIDIPRGVTVRSDGNGPLDLRATGAVTVAGIIELSGGDGGRVTACTGNGASGGMTGVPTAGATNMSCPVGVFACGGNGGTGGAGAAGLAGGFTIGGSPGTRGGGGGGGFLMTGATPGSGGGGGGGGFAGGGGGAGAGRGCVSAVGSGAAGGAGGGVGGAAGGTLGGTPGSGGTTFAGAVGTAYVGVAGTPGILCGMAGNYGGGGGGGSIGPEAAGDLPVDRDTCPPGSGGGGGGGPTGGGGGGGGGAVRLASPIGITLMTGGQVLTRGGSGGAANCGGGGGGGGSGGLVYLYAPSVTVQPGATVGADPGGGGFAVGGGGSGGAGGIGRIRVSVLPTRCTLAPVFTPTLQDASCAVTPGAGTPRAAYIRQYPE
jgi:hypothetical protein